MARYPIYPSQPNSGRLPSMCQMGPPDMRPSSSTAPYYEENLKLAHGRYLAGLGATSSANMEPAWALNELRVYAEMDDVEGDGIFDPPNAQKNIHPDAGVFAANYSLPGYHAREIPFGFSEERDITTGRPIRAVPSGAVANDSAAQIAFFERGLYPRPTPLQALTRGPVPSMPTYNVVQNPIPIGEDAPTTSNSKLKLAAGLGLGVAAAWYFFMRKGR